MCAALSARTSSITKPSDESGLNSRTAREGTFARLALACIHREYPNQIQHLLASGEDIASPRALHPVFYGCFDWHSAVHSHWLLVRLLKTTRDGRLAEEIASALATSFDPVHARAEANYLAAEDRAPFERPYGLAWLLQLAGELRGWADARATDWLAALQPLETIAARNVKRWLQHLHYPVRSGTHDQTAFAFGLFLDWAVRSHDEEMRFLVTDKSLAFHANDTDAPIHYEPSGEDFFSPSLMEADLMARVLGETALARWLERFLPDIPRDGSGNWLEVARVTDDTDGRLVHLHGLNLSRAWNLRRIGAALPAEDTRIDALLGSAERHESAGLSGVSGAHYAGRHWLGTFAVYLMSQRAECLNRSPR